MSDSVGIATDLVVGVSFNGMNDPIWDALNNSDVIRKAIVLLAILIPVKGDDVPCFWCSGTIFVPNAQAFEDLDVTFDSTFTANQTAQTFPLEDCCDKDITPVIGRLHCITNWKWFDTVIIIDQLLVSCSSATNAY